MDELEGRERARLTQVWHSAGMHMLSTVVSSDAWAVDALRRGRAESWRGSPAQFCFCCLPLVSVFCSAASQGCQRAARDCGRIRGSRRIVISSISALDDLHERKHHFVIGEELGRGGFGIVKRARDKDTGKEYACKIVLKVRIAARRARLIGRRRM